MTAWLPRGAYRCFYAANWIYKKVLTMRSCLGLQVRINTMIARTYHCSFPLKLDRTWYSVRLFLIRCLPNLHVGLQHAQLLMVRALGRAVWRPLPPCRALAICVWHSCPFRDFMASASAQPGQCNDGSKMFKAQDAMANHKCPCWKRGMRWLHKNHDIPTPQKHAGPLTVTEFCWREDETSKQHIETHSNAISWILRISHQTKRHRRQLPEFLKLRLPWGVTGNKSLNQPEGCVSNISFAHDSGLGHEQWHHFPSTSYVTVALENGPGSGRQNCAWACYCLIPSRSWVMLF